MKSLLFIIGAVLISLAWRTTKKDLQRDRAERERRLKNGPGVRSTEGQSTKGEHTES